MSEHVCYEWRQFVTVEVPFVLKQVFNLLHSMRTELAPRFKDEKQGDLDGLKLQHKHAKSSSGTSIKYRSNGLSSTIIKNLQLQGIHATPGASSSAAPSVEYSGSSNSWLDATLCLDGFMIKSAAIEFKMQKHQKQHLNLPRKVLSSHHMATKLKQPGLPVVIDQLYFVLEKSSQLLKSVEGLMNALDEDELLPILLNILDSLQECRSAISLPSRNAFPQALVSSSVGCDFTPPLSPETHLDFSIVEDELVVAVYELHVSSSNDKVISELSQSWMRPLELHSGKTFRVGSKNIYVDDHVEVRFKVHSIQWVLENLYETHNWVQSLMVEPTCVNAWVKRLETHITDIERITTNEPISFIQKTIEKTIAVEGNGDLAALIAEELARIGIKHLVLITENSDIVSKADLTVRPRYDGWPRAEATKHLIQNQINPEITVDIVDDLGHISVDAVISCSNTKYSVPCIYALASPNLLAIHQGNDEHERVENCFPATNNIISGIAVQRLFNKQTHSLIYTNDNFRVLANGAQDTLYTTK